MEIKKIKAEEEVKEEVKTDLPEETDKDLKVEEKVEEAAPEADKAEEPAESDNLIVLDSGATVDENTGLSEEEAEGLVKITKQDGTELFVEEVEGDEEEKKEVYEAILEADAPAEAVAEGLEEEVNDPLMEEEIDGVAYIPAACSTPKASLENSFFVVKLKSGKTKALKAGNIYSPNLKKALLAGLKEGKELPDETTLFNKIASKIGYTFGAFSKLASKFNAKPKETKKVEATKEVKSADIPDNIPGEQNDKSEALDNFSLDTKEVETSKLKSQIALKDKELKEAVEKAAKPAPSKVKTYYGRLPAKSNVGDEVEWSLKDFNKETTKAEKTFASQIKSLRDATKELRAQKEVIAAKEAEIKTLQEKLASIQNKEDVMIKSAKITKILASMNITDEEEKYAMSEKFAKYSKEQLDAVYETLTASPSEEATIMHERMINEEMKKEASELAGFVPATTIEEETSDVDEMESLVLKRELDFQDKNYRG